MSNWRFGIVVVVLIGKPPLMGEVMCSTENSPFLIITQSKLYPDMVDGGVSIWPDI